MEIISARPAQRITCATCGSVYAVNESDLKAEIDYLLGKPNGSAPDFLVRLTCPVCGNGGSKWLCDFPYEWRSPIIERSGLVGASLPPIKTSFL